MEDTGLVIIDVQNSFCPGGELGVDGGHDIIEPLNKMIDHALRMSWRIFATRDWHPENTKHFEKWVKHCIQNTWGAEFHPLLRLPFAYPKFQIVSKGLGDADDYSAFDVGFRPISKNLFVGGLATDYCVLSFVESALQIGYDVTVLTDTCRAVNINPGDGERALKRMEDLGALLTTTKAVIG